ncbi:unnamed protein product, partial [Prorocentrum cordatum]
MIRRTAAATAIIEANCSRAVRAALPARSRPTWRNYEIGEWVYSWTPEQTQGLEKCHWHGPALAVAVEAKVNEDNVMHASAREREERSEDPDSPLSTIEKLRRVLRRTRGTCNYQDLAEEGRMARYDDTLDDMGEQHQPSAQAPMETDETDGPTGAAAAAAPGDPQPATPGEDEGDGPAAAGAGASGSAAQEPSRCHIEAMPKRSVEEAEKLDGIPLPKRAHLSWAKLAPQSEEASLADEVDDEMLLLEEPTETVCMLAFMRKAPTIVEGRLTPEEKDQFYSAKLEALEVCNRSDGWKSINEVANARVLYQGLKHRDITDGQLDKEAPTFSRLGRHTVMLWASPRKWRLFSADVKSAFLRAEDASVHGLKLYADPTKLWHHRSDEVTKEIGFRNHEPEDCLPLSLRPARVEDDPFDARRFEGQTYAVDGLIGKHVDNFIGCGEGVTNEQARLGALDERFTSGKWEFGPSLIFTGGEMEQSLNTYSVTLKFEKYLHAVKPITVEYMHRECAVAEGAYDLQDLLDADKDLRFLKANAEVGLYFGFEKAWSNLRVGSYTDACWASRLDGSSQGGYEIFIGPTDELNANTPTPFVAMEWVSKKLQRLCRSSLSAEAQTAALGVDSHSDVDDSLPGVELATRPGARRSDGAPGRAAAHHGRDASRSAAAGLDIAEKRTAIEVKI